VGLFSRDLREVIRVVGAGKEWVTAGAPSLMARGSIRDAGCSYDCEWQKIIGRCRERVCVRVSE
jgi:hypothetical protein